MTEESAIRCRLRERYVYKHTVYIDTRRRVTHIPHHAEHYSHHVGLTPVLVHNNNYTRMQRPGSSRALCIYSVAVTTSDLCIWVKLQIAVLLGIHLPHSREIFGLHLPPLLRTDVHPHKEPCPHRHRNADSDHGPHSSREIGCKVGTVEDNAPPGVDGVASHVHGRNNDSAQTVVLIAQYIVRPGEESRLTGVHTARPVVHGEVYGSVVRICQDQGACNHTCNADPVSHFTLLAYVQKETECESHPDSVCLPESRSVLPKVLLRLCLHQLLPSDSC